MDTDPLDSWCAGFIVHVEQQNHTLGFENVIPMWPRYQSLRARLDGLKQRSETGGNLMELELSGIELI